MSSTFTSRLKLERQASGANSGNWGNLVNYVLNRIDSSVRGYVAVNVAGSANVTLVSNNSTNNTAEAADDQVHNKVIEFTGALGAAIHVFTDAVEGEYVLFNNTTGSYSLTFSNTGHAANGVAITQGTKSVIYTTGSAMSDVMTDLGSIKVSSLTSNGGATITGNTDVTGNIALKTQKAVVFEDSSGGQFAALKAAATTTSYTLTLPAATGSADQVIKTDGSGNLSFADASAGGTSWVTAVKTSNFTAVAGEGYFINTAGGAFEIDLPGSPSVGDEIVFVDFSRSFGSAALTLDQGSNKFQSVVASTTKPVYDTSGQTIQIVYSGSTQGWLPTSDDAVTNEVASPYTADFLVIAGGGGGGNDRGGGGGAGGYRNSFGSETSGGGGSSETALTLTPDAAYTITIGDAGAKATSGSLSSIAGSGITTITSAGGGAGGNGSGGNGSSGGSGGGGGHPSGTGAPGTSNQGFGGGNGRNSPILNGGGGGGAGEAAHTDGVSYGGDGLSSSITGSAVTRGGGGGGDNDPTPISNGGDGGGGNGGGEGFAATPGTANTGGGGGGGSGGGGSPTNDGMPGGKGVVILSMPDASYSGTVSGSPTVATGVSGKTVLTFNASGSYTA